MSLFITLEGPEGGGKTTQARLLAEFLRAQDLDVLLTREPGGTAIGDQTRKVITSLENTEMDPRTEFLLFSASRAQHVEEVIRPHLEQGGTVVSDRFFDSSLAYQGYGQGLDLEILRGITTFATGGLIPDLTLLLDLPCEEGLARRKQEGSWNRLDDYDLDFHQRAREGYLTMAQTEPQRWTSLDASQPVDLLQSEIRQVVTHHLRDRGVIKES